MPTPDSDWLIWSQLARDWSSVFTFVVVVVAGLFGLFRYLRSERMRQTEQVRELYRMFFDADRYRRIRFVIHAPASEEYARLRAEIESESTLPGEFESELIDLLNFLEFVSGLTRRGLVAREDVDWMFANFIKRIASDDLIRSYILRNEFKELAVLCRRKRA